jgi:hypothetical protein
MRLDIMTKMRGVDPFPDLWTRRTSLSLPESLELDVLSLPDLVASKKTQRDKDWPMIRRLVEVECAGRFRDAAQAAAAERPAVAAALGGDEREVDRRLTEEQTLEMERDRAYWEPLRKELERLRRERRQRETT